MKELLEKKAGMTMKMLAKRPEIYYAKIGVMVLGAFLLGRHTSS